ncbi:FAD-dependent oxidoreductase [Parabacteroides sp. Marseille-P3160]|uniref:FAD-dependent oxidoreductase n=1 Tax=Parabacteroides sp. Marseille-P3160 TaxID=1917887 RepID=UPI0009BAECC0|nr:FAD-dependent oxidoreductase [Parabacteroides sp. Marseille-P3160]
MRRRNFISVNLALLGGIAIGQNRAYGEALSEFADIYKEVDGSGYDLVINGGGLTGCFAALEAVKQGLRVLLLDRRTFVGFDITAKRKLWIKANGSENWPEDWGELFAPDAEKKEVFNHELTGFKDSCYGDELLLFAGSLKKGLLRTLLVNKVDVLLMTDVFGVLTDRKNNITGVSIACKQGTFVVPCNAFIDATDHNFFTRNLVGEKYRIQKAGFVMELENALLKEKTLTVNSSLGLIGDRINVHQGKKYTDQCFLEFEIPAETSDLSAIEQKARLTAAAISKNFAQIDSRLSGAKFRFHALECSFYLENTKIPQVPIAGYTYIDNLTVETHTCASLLDKWKDSANHVKGISPNKGERREHYRFYFSGKKVDAIKGIEKSFVNEKGIKLPLSRFSISELEAEEHPCSLLVAGGGTAGVTAALGAIEQKNKPTIVDYFYDLGGTKTMGGVLGYYLGLSKHPYILAFEKEVKTIASEYHLGGPVARSLSHLIALNRSEYEMIGGAIFCGATTSGDRLEKVAICENGQLKWVEAGLTIDATGDADIAYFAGESYHLGNSRIGITQNYSQWDLPYRKEGFPSFAINKDYDILDTTAINELQRGLFLSHYESVYYDFYPMLTVRESRRPEGLYTLKLTDVLSGVYFEDTIANSFSDFDPHYYGESEYTRCGFMLPHSNETTVSIPYRSIVPKTIDGLLLSGRGISQTHNAMQFTRMSADVALLGYATGQIGAEIIRAKVKPRDFSVSAFHKKWEQEGFISEENKKQEEINYIVDQLARGDAAYLAICCRMAKEKALPALREKYRQQPSLLIAKALSWFSDPIGSSLLRKELESLFKEELQIGHSADYYEEYSRGDLNSLYWKINQDVALLGMTKDKENNDLIHSILSQAISGGRKVPAKDAYNQNRIDLFLIPYYNRILNLCFYIERNPDALFIKELERLIDDENIRSQISTEYEQTRWRIYGSLLEIMLASSLARCGSKKGYIILKNYLDDVHANLRDFASRELTAISGKNFSFDKNQWNNYIQRTSFPVKKAVPVLKEIDL